MGQRLWTPKLDLPACVAQWDPEQGVTLVGGVVSQWVDCIGGVVASQATAGSRPGFSATARNGKPGLTFNGGQMMDLTPASNWPKLAEPGMVAVSAYLNSTTGNGRWPFFYGKPVSNRDNGFPGRYSTHSDQYDGVTRGMVKTGVGGVGGNALTTKMWLSNDRFVLSQFSNAASNNKPLVGTNVDGNALESSALTDSYLAATLDAGYIGYFKPYGDKWDGVIQGIYVIVGLLSTADRQKLEGYDSWKCGKAGANLPSDHPYKNAAPTVATNDNTPRRRRPLILMAA